LVVNDNFGILIAGLFRAPSTGGKSVVMKNISGADQTVRVFSTDSSNLFNDTTSGANGRSKVQVGEGSTTPTRQDVNIEDPFGVSPESDRIDVTLPAGYNSGLGKISIATLINPTGGSGAITEVCLYMFINNSAPVSQTFLIFRDVLSVPVNFIASQAINIDYEVFV